MGVGFHLTGRFPCAGDGAAVADWLEEVAAWLERRETEPLLSCRPGQCEHGEPALFVEVHPGAEELELCVPEPGTVVASARTSTAGPGFHIFLCDLLRELSQAFSLVWEDPDAEAGTGDETGYFFGAPPAHVRREMLRWLGALAHVVIDQELAEKSQVRMVSMPVEYTYPEEGNILTPLGPRTLEWFRAVADEPARGMDFFAWWAEGLGAGFFLGRALCRMWQDVRWRCPTTEAEGELLMAVHHDLERAYRLDPEAALPWREWGELLEYLCDYFGYVEFQEGTDLEDLVLDRARRSLGGTRIGYRRGAVHVFLTGGWSLTVPGDFAESWEEGGETWTAWHGERRVRFTSWTIQEDDEPQPARGILADLDLPDGQVFDHRAGPVHGRAVFRQHDEPNELGWNLQAFVAVDGSFALCDITVGGEDDLPWALDVWRSLRHTRG